MFCKFAYPDFGVRKAFFCMFIKRKKNRSGTVSIVVAEKISGYYKELHCCPEKIRQNSYY